VYRMEEDFLVLRGRLAGTTEAGSLLFVPYSEINYVGFREEIKEAQVQAMFSDSGAAVVMAPAAPAAPQPHPAQPTTVPPVPPPPPTPAPITATPTTSPGKAALLERLRRSRAGQEPTKQ